MFSLVLYRHSNRETVMTTPTKEQIYEIIKKMPSDYADFYFWGMSDEITEFIITEWEKIRNSPK